MAPRAGFEPAALRLTAECSTAELSRNGLDMNKFSAATYSPGQCPVPSALEGLTCVFGMETGVSPPLWPPRMYFAVPSKLHSEENFGQALGLLVSVSSKPCDSYTSDLSTG